MNQSIQKNILNISKKINQAAVRAGRNPAEVTLLAVTKTVAATAINQALKKGITHLGENRVTEARDKFPLLDQSKKITKHLIGHLQKNKAKKAVELFDVFQALDSSKLAKKLEQECLLKRKTLKVMIQLNLSQEKTKFGIFEKYLAGFINEMKNYPHLKLTGLMTIPPLVQNPNNNRVYFKKLKTWADKYNLPQLSMGMSQDYEIAVEEGATIVRIGSSIFGDREI